MLTVLAWINAIGCMFFIGAFIGYARAGGTVERGDLVVVAGCVFMLVLSASGLAYGETIRQLGDGPLVVVTEDDGEQRGCWTQDMGGLGLRVICPERMPTPEEWDDDEE